MDTIGPVQYPGESRCGTKGVSIILSVRCVVHFHDVSQKIHYTYNVFIQNYMKYLYVYTIYFIHKRITVKKPSLCHYTHT